MMVPRHLPVGSDRLDLGVEELEHGAVGASVHLETTVGDKREHLELLAYNELPLVELIYQIVGLLFGLG